MKDYQVLIDHAWSLNPDLFEMFRGYFQVELDKRRLIKEFHNKLHYYEVSLLRKWQDEGVGWLRPLNVMRALLPVRISQKNRRAILHPGEPASGRQKNAQQFWDDGEYRVVYKDWGPIDTIHPTLEEMELAEDMIKQGHLIAELNESLPRTEELPLPSMNGIPFWSQFAN